MWVSEAPTRPTNKSDIDLLSISKFLNKIYTTAIFFRWKKNIAHFKIYRKWKRNTAQLFSDKWHNIVCLMTWICYWHQYDCRIEEAFSRHYDTSTLEKIFLQELLENLQEMFHYIT